MNDDDIKALGENLSKVTSSFGFDMRGFDLDLVGFNCAAALEPGEPRCPFTPGCGKIPGPECELMQQRARIFQSLRTGRFE
jgi:hypothetical protein